MHVIFLDYSTQLKNHLPVLKYTWALRCMTDQKTGFSDQYNGMFDWKKLRLIWKPVAPTSEPISSTFVFVIFTSPLDDVNIVLF